MDGQSRRRRYRRYSRSRNDDDDDDCHRGGSSTKVEEENSGGSSGVEKGTFSSSEFKIFWSQLKETERFVKSADQVRDVAMCRVFKVTQLCDILPIFPLYLQLSLVESLLPYLPTKDLTRGHLEILKDQFQYNKGALGHIKSLVYNMDLSTGTKSRLQVSHTRAHALRLDHLLKKCVPRNILKAFVRDVNLSSGKNAEATLSYLITRYTISPISFGQLKYILKRTGRTPLVIRLLGQNRRALHPLSIGQVRSILIHFVPPDLDTQIRCVRWLLRHAVVPTSRFADNVVDRFESLVYTDLVNLFSSKHENEGRRALHSLFQERAREGFYPTSPIFGNMHFVERSVRRIVFVVDFGIEMNACMLTNRGELVSRYHFVVHDLMRVIAEQLAIASPLVEVNVMRSSNQVKVSKCFDRARPVNTKNVHTISQFLRDGLQPKGAAMPLQALRDAFCESPDEVFLVTVDGVRDWSAVTKAMQNRSKETSPHAHGVSETWIESVATDKYTELLRNAFRYYFPAANVCPVHCVGLFLGSDIRDDVHATQSFISQLATATSGTFRVMCGFEQQKDVENNTTRSLVQYKMAKREKFGKAYLIDISFRGIPCCCVHHFKALAIEKSKMKTLHSISVLALVAFYVVMLAATYAMLDRRGPWQVDNDAVAGNYTGACPDMFSRAKLGLMPASGFFHGWTIMYVWLGFVVVSFALPDRRRVLGGKDLSVADVYAYLAATNWGVAFYILLNVGVLLVFSADSSIGTCPLFGLQIVSLAHSYRKLRFRPDNVSGRDVKTGWEWIDATLVQPMTSTLISWTCVHIHLAFFDWVMSTSDTLFSISTEAFAIVGIVVLAIVSIVTIYSTKDICFGLPVAAFYKSLLENWSGLAFSEVSEDDFLVHMVRATFLMLCVVMIIITHQFLGDVVTYFQITRVKFPLSPDRKKMQLVVRKQVLNTTAFALVLTATFFRSGSYRYVGSSDGAVESTERFGVFGSGAISPLNGVCGGAVFADSRHVVPILPSAWWFASLWLILAYLTFTIAVQSLPYTFLTKRGKHLEHRTVSLRLRTTYVRHFFENFLYLKLPRCCCFCGNRRIPVMTKFWQWGLTRAAYMTFHTRTSSLFIASSVSAVAFHIFWSFNSTALAFVALLCLLILLIYWATKVGLGLNFGYVSHKISNKQYRRDRLEKTRRKIETERMMVEKRDEEKSDWGLGSSRTSQLKRMVEKTGTRLVRKIKRKEGSKKDMFASRVLLYALYWPLALYIGWVWYAFTIMLGFVLRDFSDGESIQITHVSILYMSTILIGFFAYTRHDFVCLLPFMVGLGATVHMNTVKTCKSTSYTGFDYRNNYSPPLHTQWDAGNASACSTESSDWLNISNTYAWLENPEGTSRCRILLDLDRFATTCTVSVVTNDGNFTVADATRAFESTKSTFVSNESSTIRSVLGTSESGASSFSLSIVVYPVVSNASNVGGASWVDSFASASSVNTTTNTFTVTVGDVLSSVRVFYLAEESECFDSSTSSTAQKARSSGWEGRNFPENVRVNKGFHYFAGPVTDRGYCAEDPGTCDVRSFEDLMLSRDGRTTEHVQIQHSIMCMLILGALIVVLFILGRRKRARARRHRHAV
eukprot:g2097.t1